MAPSCPPVVTSLCRACAGWMGSRVWGPSGTLSSWSWRETWALRRTQGGARGYTHVLNLGILISTFPGLGLIGCCFSGGGKQGPLGSHMATSLLFFQCPSPRPSGSHCLTSYLSQPSLRNLFWGFLEKYLTDLDFRV